MPSVFSAPAFNETPWMVRADFTDQPTWDAVARAALVDPAQPDEAPPVEFTLVDDVAFAGLTPSGLLALEPHRSGQYFLVDARTIADPEHPLLAVDVSDEPGRSFRLIPACVQEFAANMLISNMDFEDFADSVDTDGVFRGFGSTAAHPAPPVAPAPTGPAGSVTDLLREADADDPTSFVGGLIRTGFWNPAAWQRLEAGMREACRLYDGAPEVPRALTEAVHSVMVRVPNLVVQPGFHPMDAEVLSARLDRIRVLSAWFLRGWSMNRPAGPLPGEYDPDGDRG